MLHTAKSKGVLADVVQGDAAWSALGLSRLLVVAKGQDVFRLSVVSSAGLGAPRVVVKGSKTKEAYAVVASWAPG